MANMSYCRFQNTLRDLADCQNALEDLFAGDRALSREELAAAKRLVEGCFDIVQLVADQRGIDLDDGDAAEDFQEHFESVLDTANQQAEPIQ